MTQTTAYGRWVTYRPGEGGLPVAHTRAVALMQGAMFGAMGLPADPNEAPAYLRLVSNGPTWAHAVTDPGQDGGST